MTGNETGLAVMERQIDRLKKLERAYEEQIAELSESIKTTRGSDKAAMMFDVRAEIRLALKELKAAIADLEARYYAALRRARG